jgi:hypothetical protein
MKNRNIRHARQEVKIYEMHYKPSFNILRFTKSILGVLIFGRTTVAHSAIASRMKTLSR